MNITVNVGDMPTTTKKLLDALTGINVGIHGTDDSYVEVEVIGGAETEVGYDTNLLGHPWRTVEGLDKLDKDTTLIIPCALVETVEVL